MKQHWIRLITRLQLEETVLTLMTYGLKVKHGFFNFVFVGMFDFVDLEDEDENLASLSLPM